MSENEGMGEELDVGKVKEVALRLTNVFEECEVDFIDALIILETLKDAIVKWMVIKEVLGDKAIDLIALLSSEDVIKEAEEALKDVD